MNSAALAQSGYAKATRIAPSGRDAEYRAFATVTRQLADRAEADGQDFPRLAEAVYENQKLWTLLATDVASEENGLPPELRAQIFYLSDFTRAHSAKVLDGSASAAVLVEINTAVMRGLRGDIADPGSGIEQ